MTVPLIVLAVGSIVAGCMGSPVGDGVERGSTAFLQPDPSLPIAGSARGGAPRRRCSLESLLMAVAIAVAARASSSPCVLVRRRRGLRRTRRLAAAFPGVHRVALQQVLRGRALRRDVVSRGAWRLARLCSASTRGSSTASGQRRAHVTVASAMLSGVLRQVRRRRAGQLTRHGPRPVLAAVPPSSRPGTCRTTRWCWRSGMFALVAVYMLIYRG